MSLERQAGRLREAFRELMICRPLQDPGGTGGQGSSLLQRGALDAVDRLGPLTMRGLADQLHVDAGGMTRVVGSLAGDGLVVRFKEPDDRRVCCVRITGRGKARITKIRSDLVRECRRVLLEMPVKKREGVIASMTHLLSARHRRQRRSSARAPSRRQRAGGSCSSGAAGRKASIR